MTQATINKAEPTIQQDTVIHRIVDNVAAFSGSIAFLIMNATLFTVWIVVNTVFPKHFHFDDFPFAFLTLAVSLEAIFLSIFVLISQNRQASRDKAHDEEERKRQQALMQEDLSLNRKEERQESEILTLIQEVKVAQQEIQVAQSEHRTILEKLEEALQAKAV